MCLFVKYLLGEQKFWLGKPMKEAHQHLKITEEHFDIYYKTFTNALKSIKTPIKIM